MRREKDKPKIPIIDDDPGQRTTLSDRVMMDKKRVLIVKTIDFFVRHPYS